MISVLHLTYGSLINKLEADVLAAMTTLAVHGENTMVANASSMR